MNRERLIKEIQDNHWSYDGEFGIDYSEDVADLFLKIHTAEAEPLRQSLEKLLSRRDALDFIEGKDAYMQVDVNDMNNALNLLKLAREVA